MRRCLVLALALVPTSTAQAQAEAVSRVAMYLAYPVPYTTTRPGPLNGINRQYAYIFRFREDLDRLLGSWEVLGQWGNDFASDTSKRSFGDDGVIVFVGDMKRAEGGDVADGVVFVTRVTQNSQRVSPRGQGQPFYYRWERYDRVYAGCRTRTLRFEGVKIAESEWPAGAGMSAQYDMPQGSPLDLTPKPGSIGDSLVRYLCFAPPVRLRTPAEARARDIIGTNLAWVSTPNPFTGDSLYRISGKNRKYYEGKSRDLLKTAKTTGWRPAGWWGFGPFRKDYFPEYVVLAVNADSATSSGGSREVHVLADRFRAFSVDTIGRYVTDYYPPERRWADFTLRLTCAPRTVAVYRLSFSDFGHPNVHIGVDPGPPVLMTTPVYAAAPDDGVPLDIVADTPADAIVRTVCDGASPK